MIFPVLPQELRPPINKAFEISLRRQPAGLGCFNGQIGYDGGGSVWLNSLISLYAKVSKLRLCPAAPQPIAGLPGSTKATLNNLC
jgi:hypothetical protein